MNVAKNLSMKLEELKSHLQSNQELNLILPNGQFVPKHFHITEVGMNTRHFIDCGGTERIEKKVNLQLWVEDRDPDHRLSPEKLLSIINLSQEKIGLGNLEIEVEYQGQTIGKYGLEYESGNYLLTSTQTDCLAKDLCGIPEEKVKLNLADLSNTGSTCTPGGGCC